MITHNESLRDNITDLINIISHKANQYNDPELKELLQDVDWMMKDKLLPLITREEKEQENDGAVSYDYDQGYEDGYEEAKEAMLNAL